MFPSFCSQDEKLSPQIWHKATPPSLSYPSLLTVMDHRLSAMVGSLSPFLVLPWDQSVDKHRRLLLVEYECQLRPPVDSDVDLKRVSEFPSA